MRIAVDAMGGDHAPHEIVKGAILAAKEYDIDIILIGDERLIKQELERSSNSDQSKIFLVHTEEFISMEDSPSLAVRRKRNSSIHIGLKMVKNGEASAFFSAGNTGAVMAASKLILRTLDGVDRPAIGAVIPNEISSTVMLDVGANVDCKPIHFLQFAIMGAAYAKFILDKEKPRVSLLSIGEEDVKGNEQTKSVFGLLKEFNGINFIGNIEGKEIFKGNTDVIVCDGFAGNVALKTIEATAAYIGKILKEELNRNIITKIGALISKSAFKQLRQRADYTEYGGAPLLGVNGISIIGHGGSNANAVKNGIRVAKELSERKVNKYIEENIRDSYNLLNIDKTDSFWENILGKFKK